MADYPYETPGERDRLLREATKAARACEDAMYACRIQDAAIEADQAAGFYDKLGRHRAERDWQVRAETLRAVLAGQVANATRLGSVA